MSNDEGSGQDNDARWRERVRAWSRDPIHRYAYEKVGSAWEEVDSLSYKPEHKRHDLGLLQMRLRREQCQRSGTSGIYMVPAGCPVRFPESIPWDEWVRPFIRLGKKKENPRPHFRNPNQPKNDDAPQQRRVDRDFGERLAAVEEIFLGARAAGWHSARHFPERGSYADAACWTEIHGRQIEVAFRIQLGHRILGEFVEAADLAKAKGINLIWLMAQRNGKDVASLPNNIPDVPIVRMEALLNKRDDEESISDGGVELKQTAEVSTFGSEQQDAADDLLFRVPLVKAGPPEWLGLAPYIERVLRAIRFRRDPAKRRFSAPLGWVRCPNCRKRCLSFGNFEPQEKHASWQGTELVAFTLPLDEIVDRPLLNDFRERMGRHAPDVAVAEIAWTDASGTWIGHRHCPDANCFARLPPMREAWGEYPQRLAVEFRLTPRELDQILGSMSVMGINSEQFPALRSPDSKGRAEAQVEVQSAQRERTAIEEAWEQLLQQERDCRRAIQEVERALREMKMLQKQLASDLNAFGKPGAHDATLVRLQAELTRIHARRVSTAEVKLKLERLELLIQANEATPEHCETLKDKARRADADRVARLLLEHDQAVPDMLEQFKQTWSHEQLADGEARLEETTTALQRLEAEPQAWLWSRLLQRRERKKLKHALKVAAETLEQRRAEAMGDEGRARLSAAVVGKCGELAETRRKLVGDLASAREAVETWKYAEARLADKNTRLEERRTLLGHLVDVQAAEKEIQTIEEGIRAALTAREERARLTAGIQRAESILGGREETERELDALRKLARKLSEEAHPLKLRRRETVSRVAVAEGALELVGPEGGGPVAPV